MGAPRVLANHWTRSVADGRRAPRGGGGVVHILVRRQEVAEGSRVAGCEFGQVGEGSVLGGEATCVCAGQRLGERRSWNFGACLLHLLERHAFNATCGLSGVAQLLPRFNVLPL